MMRADGRGPVISIVTVTFNDASGLARTMRSVGDQTHEQLEHIVIDGGSSGRAREIVAGYAPSYPVTVVSEPDEGIFDAINKGIGLATGDLVVCMNSGDAFTDAGDLAFVAADWLESRWSWAYGCMRYVDEEGEAFSGDVQAPFNKRKLELGLAFVPHQTMYVDLEFQRQAGEYDARYGIAADQEMAVRLAQRAEPKVLIRFLTDFLVGGAHARVSRWHRERLYHRIRIEHGRGVLGSGATDLAVTGAISVARSGRDLVAHSLNPRGRRRI